MGDASCFWSEAADEICAKFSGCGGEMAKERNVGVSVRVDDAIYRWKEIFMRSARYIFIIHEETRGFGCCSFYWNRGSWTYGLCIR